MVDTHAKFQVSIFFGEGCREGMGWFWGRSFNLKHSVRALAEAAAVLALLAEATYSYGGVFGFSRDRASFTTVEMSG